MLTGITLENFKAFKEPRFIPLKPITLVFGPNSSGKSSIIHALAFLKSVHDSKGYCDRDIVDFGWSKVHLGSWLNLVYGHTPDASMKITLHFNDEDTIRWTFEQGHKGPRVAEFLIAKKGQPIARGKNTSDRLIQWDIDLHRSHMVWKTYRNIIRGHLLDTPGSGVNSIDSDFDQWLGQDWKPIPKTLEDSDKYRHENRPVKYDSLFPGVLCHIDREIDLEIDLIRTLGTLTVERDDFEPEVIREALGDHDKTNAYFDEKLDLFKWRALTNTMEVSFESQLYVGNDRNRPTGLLTRRALPDTAAMKPWLTLIDNESEGYLSLTPREELNGFFKSLEINYSVETRLRKETVITGLGDDTETREEGYVSQEELVFKDSNQVHHPIHALGSGIGKILPNLVAMASSEAKLLILEEPESNIHPRLQTALGDIVIQSSCIDRGIVEAGGELYDPNEWNRTSAILLETHSEHLILRILRRIRETTEDEMDDWPDELKRSCPEGITPDDVSVVYIEPGEDGAKVCLLPVTSDGDFSRPWPKGFFTERSKELY